MSGQTEEFTPLNADQVRMYTCGPTVHDYAHIGNFRTFLFEDLLRRVLMQQGYQVTQVMNLTDVEDRIGKEALCVFAPGKARKPGEQSWDTPLGAGRPGWHIECSGVSMKYLGESFDIHTGGVDNIFPPPENEIAQSESATGKTFARYWLHAQHLQDAVGEKMSKRLKNFSTLRDLLAEGYQPRAIRYALITGARSEER